MSNKIAIIGGGASGLIAAVSAAKKNAAVTVFERNVKPGKKILMTGNGKCNLTNVTMSQDLYYSEDRDFIGRVFSRFGFNETIAFFNSVGLLLTEKRGGIYPNSEQASTVLDALYLEILSLGVRLKCDSFVKEIKREGMQFRVSYDVVSENGCVSKEEFFDKVILACGGKAAPKTGSDGNGYKLAEKFGIKPTKTFPALCGASCEGDFWKSISGVRSQAGILIENDTTGEGVSFGELQFTDYGISGIPVFQISRIMASMLDEKIKTVVDIDLMPDVDESVVFNEISARVVILPDRTCEQILNGIINKKLSVCILKRAGIKLTDKFTGDNEKVAKVVNQIKHFRATVSRVNSFDQAQTTAGGIRLKDIKDTFEAKSVPGLFFAGEILDVDGICGGYNLQWAWSSGFIAGEEAAGC